MWLIHSCLYWSTGLSQFFCHGAGLCSQFAKERGGSLCTKNAPLGYLVFLSTWIFHICVIKESCNSRKNLSVGCIHGKKLPALSRLGFLSFYLLSR